ncbi:MAG TPA: hypothetical protein VIJ47_14145 [Acidimicrobiales bacterium]
MSVETELKWHLLDEPDPEQLGAFGSEPTRIEQHYLSTVDGAEERVRHLSGPTGQRFVHTIKRDRPGIGGALVREENEHDITRAQYRAVLDANADVGDVVVKDRWRFTYQKHDFELDQFHTPDVGWLLELELRPDETHTQVSLPAWLGSVVEVTSDPRWRNAALAKLGQHQSTTNLRDRPQAFRPPSLASGEAADTGPPNDAGR